MIDALDVGRAFQTVGFIVLVLAAVSVVIAGLTLVVRRDVAAGVVAVLRYRRYARREKTHSKYVRPETKRAHRKQVVRQELQLAKSKMSGDLTLVRRFFAERSVSTEDDVRGVLWSSVDSLAQGGEIKEYSVALLEQYKVYVETADRISARRWLTNILFLTLNSAIFTVIGVFLTNRPHAASWLLVFPSLVLMGQCVAWFWLVRSYRQLDAAKYAVIGAMEERLPASPYWRAEWKALGEGRDPSKYWQLSHLERWIPLLFAASYLGGFIAVLTT